MYGKILLVIFAFSVSLSLSARILGIVPTPSYSHQIVFKKLWIELSLRGHEVTLLTTDPINNSSLTNLTEINLQFAYKILQAELRNLIAISEKSFLQYVQGHLQTFDKIVDAELSHPEVQAIIKNKNVSFDLLMVESMHPAMYAFSKLFNCPYIVISSMDVYQNHYTLLGNPTHPILYPEMAFSLSKTPTFKERFKVVMWSGIIKYVLADIFKAGCTTLIEKHFGEEYLPLDDILKEISLLLINTNPIFHQIRPLVPAVIQIGGGATIAASKTLPKDLQKQLDKSKNGFIYFSLRSNANSKDLSFKTQKSILDAFSELPYTILWKYENPDLPGKPENVIIAKWLPQQDVLNHPNIKLFITHGGQQSIDETIHFQIPIVGMPVFADQPANIARLVKVGIGLEVDSKQFNKDIFKSTILEVIDNPKYKNKITELSNLVKDTPMTGLQKAVWWTEYVIRHKGAKHLRSSAIDLPFYQFYLLDIIGFSVLVLIITAALLTFIIKKVYRIAQCLARKIYSTSAKIKKQ